MEGKKDAQISPYLHLLALQSLFFCLEVLCGSGYTGGMRRSRRPQWDAARVRALRHHLGLTQEELAARMGVRQQTISEWERGVYRPRGASATLLSMVAEGAGFGYRAEAGRAED